MPGTARDLGLKVSRQCDERTDYYKSTRAAALYLRDLYVQFGDWLLVVAAYNGGPAPVYKAIRYAGNRNFWSMQQYLPAESRGEVKRFIATHYYFEGQGSIATLTKPERMQYLYAVRKFEGARPEINSPRTKTPARKSKTTDTRALYINAVDEDQNATASNYPFYSPAISTETEDDRFNRIMVSAESALSTSTSMIDGRMAKK
jgi:hypothetical protein